MLAYLVTVLVLLLSFFIRRRWRFRTLPSPGLCLPFIGHGYKGRLDIVAWLLSVTVRLMVILL